MAKKHRVKRQNYVKHLLKLERERDKYIEKRKNVKRSRMMRNDEDGTIGAARDVADEGQSVKRQRREDESVPSAAGAAVLQTTGEGERAARQQRSDMIKHEEHQQQQYSSSESEQKPLAAKRAVAEQSSGLTSLAKANRAPLAKSTSKKLKRHY